MEKYNGESVMIPRDAFASFWNAFQRHPLAERAIFDAKLVEVDGGEKVFSVTVQLPETIASEYEVQRLIDYAVQRSIVEDQRSIVEEISGT